MTYIPVPAVSPINDKLALAYYNQGSTPEDVMANLKANNYVIQGKYKVQAVVVANLVRGIYLAQTIKPKTRTKKSA